VQLKSKPKSGFENLHYADGETIFQSGDIGDYLYVIAKGSVNVIKDGELVATLQEGQYFGEMALLSTNRRSATIIAKGSCSILAIKKDDFHVLMSHFSDLRENFIKTKEGRLDATAEGQ
jgi:CRP-like cAMP-binding protein